MNKRLVSLTEELIRIPSTRENPKELQEILLLAKKQLSSFPSVDYPSESNPSTLFGNRINDRHFTVMLHAHLDVSAADNRYFKPEVKDGKIYGRGVYDTKAAAAAMIIVFKELGEKLSYPLGLQFTTEGTFHGNTSIQQQIVAGLQAKFVITSEGSNLHIVHRTKGHMLITLKGEKTGHEAIVQMNEVIRILSEKYPIPHEATPATTLAVTKLETDEDQKCIAEIDIRYFTATIESIIDDIQAILPKDISLEKKFHMVPNRTDENSTYIKKLQEATKKITKKEPPLQKTHGGSEASFFCQNGIEVVEFGPEGFGLGHINVKENVEWVSLQGLQDYYEILKHFLLSLDK